MRAYSQDLRERVIAAIELGEETQAEVAECFAISLSTLEKWWARWTQTQSCAVLPEGRGPTATLAPCAAVIRAEVEAHPDATLEEVCERVQTRCDCRASVSMMCRALQRLGLPRKKKILRDSQRDTPRVQAVRLEFQDDFMATAGVWLKHLNFFDEFGLNLGLTRLYGRAAPGVRVEEATPGHSGAHYTAVAALGWAGIRAPSIWEGAMTAARFEAYVREDLAPVLRRGEILVVDNLSAHKCVGAREALAARDVRLVFLPPYSPDFNPIELCWSKVKTALRAAKARTWEAIVDALALALRSVCRQDIQAWFAHCGYLLP